MKTAHFMLQGKGGVGKSLMASVLAQHRSQYHAPVLNIDTDPVNATFAGYEAFNATVLDIMEGNAVSPQRFDTLVEMLVETTANEIIIDNGASSFIPLLDYLLKYEIPAILQSEGIQMVIHTVITGGQALLDTLSGFRTVADQFQAHARLIVWINTFFGPVEHNGKSFEQMKVYHDFESVIDGIIELDYPGELFKTSMQQLLESRTTFAEAQHSDRFSFMDRHRLRTVRELLFTQLDAVIGAPIDPNANVTPIAQHGD